jgi:hypothetical protein
LFFKQIDNGVTPILIIDTSGFEDGCFSGSALAADCRMVVISISNAFLRYMQTFSIKKKKQLPLFHLVRRDCVEDAVLASVAGLGCYLVEVTVQPTVTWTLCYSQEPT